jgi:hypothetical protein
MAHSTFWRRIGLWSVAVAAVGIGSAAKTGPITRLSIDPAAPVVPLFDGAAAGRFEVRMSAVDPYQSHVFVTNSTDEPLTVALPKAAVGVHVLPQFNAFNNGFFNGNNVFQNNAVGQNGAGNGNGNAGNQNGLANMAQSVGGALGSTAGGPGNGIGNGFPSIPAEWSAKEGLDSFAGFATVPANKTIQLQLRTVCLNYGRPDPHAKKQYALVPVEQFSSDPVLAELLEQYTPRVEQDVMQAAAWHVANGLSWEQLSQLPDKRLPGTSARLFNARQVQSARSFAEGVAAAAKHRPVATEVAKSDRR